MMLAALRCVDLVVSFSGLHCATYLRTIAPDVYVKGGDYNIGNMNPNELAALRECNADIRFTQRQIQLSTTELAGRIYRALTNVHAHKGGAA